MTKHSNISSANALESNQVLEHYQALLSPRAKSLVSTIFGDIIAPYGGQIWLGNLIELLAPLEVSERLVRTTLFRLNEEGWTYNTRLGRQSVYQLSHTATEQTQRMESLIYHPQTEDWDGSWLFVFLVLKSIKVDARNILEQELKWMGFGAVSRHVWAHPRASIEVLENRIKTLGLESQVVCMRAQNIFNEQSGLTLDDSQLAQLCTPTHEVEKAYKNFIENFAPLYDKLDTLLETTPNSTLFALRVLLIDQFRHAVLRDPHLPSTLLPNNWVGHQARKLCKDIYQKLLKPANNFYEELLINNTDLPEKTKKTPDNNYQRRFTD